MFHLDCFRLRAPDEAADLDWEGLLRDGDAILVEWPERAGAWLPRPDAAVSAAPPGRSRSGGGWRSSDVAGAGNRDRPRLGGASATGRSDAVEEGLTGARRHAAALLPMIEAVLRRRGVTLDQVSGVVVSDGPGSFTGLRVGASVAKALARSRGLPLWTAPSLVVRAAGVAGSDRSRVLAVSDALRGELYAAWSRGSTRRGGIETELGPGVWRPEALAELELSARRSGRRGARRDAAALLERRTGLEADRAAGGRAARGAD